MAAEAVARRLPFNRAEVRIWARFCHETSFECELAGTRVVNCAMRAFKTWDDTGLQREAAADGAR